MSRREFIKGSSKVTLVVNTVSNGSVTINGQSGTEFKFKRKESVLIQATANSSYYVASLNVNGTNVSNPYTLVITENTTVIATMNIIAYGAITWSNAGSYGFSVPANIVRLRINVRGGGGGGGGGCASPNSRIGGNGGNGGTGGQVYSVIGVSPGQYFGVTVGGGGGGGAYAVASSFTSSATAQSGGNGGNSYFGGYGAPGGGGGGGAYFNETFYGDGADGTSFGGGADGGAGGWKNNNGSAGGTGSVSVEWGAGI